MAGEQPTTACAHTRLHAGSAGYYLMCLDCPQRWVALRVGGESDTDLDRGPPLTCTTPAASGGTWEWAKNKPFDDWGRIG